MMTLGIEERQAIDPTSPWWVIHVARYLFAKNHVENCRVLDIACGTGYGINILLAAGAQLVVGVDIDQEAGLGAQKNLTSRAGQVIVADGCQLPFADGSFEVITSFETLEHLTERPRFLSELKRVMAPKGRLILSTPNANHTQPINGKPVNPYHVFEYTPEELGTELRSHFSNVTMLGQILDPRFKIPPFWDEQRKLAQDKHMRWEILLWRALNKLPTIIGDSVSRRLWGHPVRPCETDYHFSVSSVESAPVLVAYCSVAGASRD